MQLQDQRMPRRCVVAAMAVAAGLGAPQLAAAASGTWNVDASDNWNLSTTAPWLNGAVAAGADATAFFNTVNITGARTVTLTAPLTIGNLSFADATTATHDWTLTNNTLTLDTTAGTPTITVENRTARINSILAGNDGLTKAGAGTLTLAGNNTFSGTTTINAGVLQIGADSTSGSVAGNIVNNATLRVQRGNAITIGGNITGTGALTKFNGSGVLTLTGNNTYAGGTSLTDGGILLGSGTNNGIGTGTLTIGRGRVGSSDNAARTIGNTLSINLSGNLTFGAAVQGATDGLGDLTFTDATSGTGPGASTTITVHNATTVTLHKQLTGGSSQITKAGEGTLVLNGATLSYGGATTVNGGELLVNGNKTGSGAVNVNANAALGGTGAVAGATTFAADSTFLALVDGSLDFSGALTLSNGALIATDDVLTAASYTVLTFAPGSRTGTFTVDSSITSQNYEVAYTSNAVVLQAVPEPATVALLCCGALLIASRRRA